MIAKPAPSSSTVQAPPADSQLDGAGWTAIVLAGQRPEGDPLAEQCGKQFKALIEIAGRSMLSRVCETLLSCPDVARIVILAQEPARLLEGDTAALADEPRIHLASSDAGISGSIAAIAGSDKAPWPVLITTADHALLSRDMVGEFLAKAVDCDVAIGVGERRIIEGAYPETRRTWLKFSDGQFSGANLFALRGHRALSALEFWSGIEQDRKKSLSIISRFGLPLLLRALTRTIAFPDAVGRAGRRLGLAAKPVIMSQPEAAIDVDKLADLHLVEAILANSGHEDSDADEPR